MTLGSNKSTIQKPDTESDLAFSLEEFLNTNLPPSWLISIEEQRGSSVRGRPDLVARVQAPDGASTRLVVELKKKLDSADLSSAVRQLNYHLDEMRGAEEGTCGVIVAPYIPFATQEWLKERGLSYLDATGNARIACRRPAMFIQRAGADRNPWPTSRSLRTLKGAATGAAVRALVDFKPPYGLRELASRADISLATLSRVVDLLEQEGIVEREPRGPIREVDWEAAIRRWSLDYEVLESNGSKSFLAPRGAEAAVAELRRSGLQYSVTGSWAVPDTAKVAPSRLLMTYASKPLLVAEQIDLRRVEAGANVILLEPYNQVVFQRTRDNGGVQNAAVSQVSVDLLTGPGRAPSEAEGLLEWMKARADDWRQ